MLSVEEQNRSKQLLARRVAADVLRSDASIRELIVVDKDAALLAVSSAEGPSGISNIDLRSLENLGALVRLFLEASKTASVDFGGM